jgi:hypothetical protein
MRPSPALPPAGSLALWLAALHGLMMVYDWLHPDVFLHADRAHQRLQIANRLAGELAGPWPHIGILPADGVPGDYLVQGVLYALGGRFPVILLQVLLVIGSAVALCLTVRQLTGRPRLAAGTAALYALLPHQLIFPHVLGSEALFDPLLVLACTGSILVLVRPGGRWTPSVSGALLGLATLVRPVIMVWAPVEAVFLLAGGARPRRVAGHLLLALLPLALWMGAVRLETGSFSLGNGHLGENLFIRTRIMIDTLPDGERQAATRRFLLPAAGAREALARPDYFTFGPVLSAGQYLRFCLAYPREALGRAAGDAVLFFTKSGVEKITVDYLDLAGKRRDVLQDNQNGWHQTFERIGLWATLKQLFGEMPVVIAISLLGGIAIAVMWGGALAGMVAVFAPVGRRLWPPEARIALSSQVALIVYIFAVSTTAYMFTSRYRAPVEFAVCTFFACAWHAIGAVNAERRLPRTGAVPVVNNARDRRGDS